MMTRRPTTAPRTAPRRTRTSAMPASYPAVSLRTAIADGTRPSTLRMVAARIGATHPQQADALRRVAQQLAAENDNRARRAA